MNHIIIGSGGILGSAFRAQLEHRGAPSVMLSPTWAKPATVAQLLRYDLDRLLRAGQPTTIIWAAGVGHVGASEEDMSSETIGIAAVGEALCSLPRHQAEAVKLIFASSAGALFAGVTGMIEDDTHPCPVSPYGRQKLRQEDLLRRAADESGACVVSCRMSNIYGLAKGRLTARGLISTAVRCTRLRQPMTIFVSSDTRRDYVLSTDAAAIALQSAKCASNGFSTALICESRTRTIAEILSLVSAVARRRVPAVYAERPETRMQPRALRFSASATPQHTRFTPLEVGIARMVMAPLFV